MYFNLREILKIKKIIFDIINMEFLIEFFIFIFWQVHYNKQARIKKIEGIFFWSYWIPFIFFIDILIWEDKPYVYCLTYVPIFTEWLSVPVTRLAE